MEYSGTQKVVRVGDTVRYAGIAGIIVFVIDDDSYSDRYPKDHWGYLGKGLGVELQEGAWHGTLFHLNSADEEEDLEPLNNDNAAQ